MSSEAPESMDAHRLDSEFDGLRGALVAHCYRMVGSYDDAEDLVQETYLRARRGIDGFEGRSSLKTWLYRIATNTCLTALQHRDRRVLPAGLGAASDDPDEQMRVDLGREWIQPLPQAALGGSAALDPSEVVIQRDTLRLALITALQALPPRQRAVFLLREVLLWPASEVAAELDISVPAVKSLLQRARARLAEVDASSAATAAAAPTSPEARAALDKFVRAFETSDISELESLITDDFSIQLPPSDVWFSGRRTCLPFLERYAIGIPGDWRLHPTIVNGQPASASFLRDEDGIHRPKCLCVLDVTTGGQLRGVTVFEGERVVMAALADSAAAGM